MAPFSESNSHRPIDPQSGGPRRGISQAVVATLTAGMIEKLYVYGKEEIVARGTVLLARGSRSSS